MTLSQVSTVIAARIAAVPALAALGSLLPFDELADAVAFDTALAAAIDAKGVAFVMPEPEIASAQPDAYGHPIARVSIELQVPESVAVAHTPSGLALVDAVVAAVCARSGTSVEEITFEAYEKDESSGLVVRLLSFSAQVAF